MRRILRISLVALALVAGLAVVADSQSTWVPGLMRGHLLFSPDNTYDIGANGATRARDVYAARNLLTGADTSSNVYVNSTRINSPSDGVLQLLNNAGTGFTRLQLGGTTTSFPGLTPSGANLFVTNATGSTYTNLNALNFYADAAAITPTVATGTTVGTAGTIVRQVYKVTIDESAFVCAGVTCDVTVATLPAKTYLVAAIADVTTTFACSSVCTSATLTATMGKSAGGNEYLLSFNLNTAVATFGDTAAELGASLAPTTAQTLAGDIVGHFGSTATVTMRLTSGTGNIGNGSVNTISQGSVTIYLVTERLP